MISRRRKKPIRLPISKHIDVNYRNYALYVLEQRGIPSYYDGLTNVQRLILHNAPQTFDKTMTLVGSCFKAGYHHGDSSLIGAINKLARNFNCAEVLLDGDGFFGTPLNNEPAAARYTSVKLNNEVSKIIKEHHFLDSKNDDGFWNPLWLNQPLGLDTMIIGIAVGYKTVVLPRNRKHVSDFLEGKRKTLKPFFKGFTGKISKIKDLERSWLFEGNVEITERLRSVYISDLPPLMKYKSFLKKLDKVLEFFDFKVEIINNSSTNIDLTLNFRGSIHDWNEFKEKILNSTRMIVTEKPVFIKDGLVIEYDKIEDYLNDFKYRVAQLNVEKTKYFLEQIKNKISFNEAKLLYLMFMLKQKRTLDDIEKFLNRFPNEITNRLESILLKQLNDKEILKTKELIKESKKEKIKLTKELNKLEKIFSKLIDTANSRGIQNKASAVDLFSDEISEYNGIEIFNVKDKEDEEEIEES
jgi:topoisomerase-4 subunit A